MTDEVKTTEEVVATADTTEATPVATKEIAPE